MHFDHYIETPLDTNEIAWKKRIIKAELVLDNCDDNVNNTDYNLQTKFIPLDFKGLMIEFAQGLLIFFPWGCASMMATSRPTSLG